MKTLNTDIFATDEFIEDNRSLYDQYIKLRVHGHPAHQSFIRVFGAEFWEGPQQGYNRIQAMEYTPYFQTQFDKVLEATPVSELWNAKKAINGLLTLANDPMVRDSTRLKAQDNLSLLAGIVVVDENGKTKAGRSLADFYAGIAGPESE
jgi:hypothetical protein